jgi:hypothetical protein
MRSYIFAFLFLCATAYAADEHGDHAQTGPDQTAKSACDAYSWDMRREFSLLRATPYALSASQQPDPEARYAPLDRKLDLTLLPAAKVTLLEKPGREAKADSYAGLVLLRVPRMSSYRISSDQRVWIDVIGPAGVVKSSKFDMQAGCELLRKSVAFPLEPETEYWVQLSGSPTEHATLIVTLDR